MTQKGFALAAGIMFTLVFVLHTVRLISGQEAVIGGVTIPLWVSWLALPIAGVLAYYGYRYQRQQRWCSP